MSRPAALCLLGALAVGACGGDDASQADAVTIEGVTVSDAWVRPTPPGADQVAIYLTVEHHDGPGDEVVWTESPRCASVVPHRTVISDDGVASMPSVIGDELTLAPGGAIVLEPLGLHLMCLGLADPLVVGDHFDLTVELRGRGAAVVQVAVEDR